MNKVPVSERALLARINRRLRDDDEVVKKCREDSRAYYELGDYYILGISVGGINEKNIDLEDYGRELGCLADYEEMTQ